MNATLNHLLKQTSRSFYLTLRVLPGAVRPQIGLAYLLARTADTIADTELVPLDQRLGALQKLRERILGQNPTPLNFGEFAGGRVRPWTAPCWSRSKPPSRNSENFPPPDGQLVRDVLATITSGQELDLRRFAGASAEKIIALETAPELDDYTYRVAGCVGEFWTKMCRAHLFPRARLEERQFIADGVRFGKGLQLVNILRDLPADLRKGRCYLPHGKTGAGEIISGNLAVAGERGEVPAVVSWLSGRGGGASGGGLALHQHAAVRAIPRAAGVRVAHLDRRPDD